MVIKREYVGRILGFYWRENGEKLMKRRTTQNSNLWTFTILWEERFSRSFESITKWEGEQMDGPNRCSWWTTWLNLERKDGIRCYFANIVNCNGIRKRQENSNVLLSIFFHPSSFGKNMRHPLGFVNSPSHGLVQRVILAFTRLLLLRRNVVVNKIVYCSWEIVVFSGPFGEEKG